MIRPKILDRFIIRLLRFLGLHAFFVLYRHSALKEDGWFGSFAKQESMDGNGHPIPWIPYVARDFLEPRLSQDMSVFEFGAGSSTFWWALHVNSVTSVEHDYAWYRHVDAIRPSNTQLLLCPLEPAEAYANSILVTAVGYDLVFIDGRHRVKCLDAGTKALTSRGVIILDNSERAEYQDGINRLLEKGFRAIEFKGMAPSIAQKSQTSIFYRDGNVLGI